MSRSRLSYKTDKSARTVKIFSGHKHTLCKRAALIDMPVGSIDKPRPIFPASGYGADLAAPYGVMRYTSVVPGSLQTGPASRQSQGSP